MSNDGDTFTVGISIHALLTESDLALVAVDFRIVAISIHALLTESDQRLCLLCDHCRQFQSTLSSRRATCACGESDTTSQISIHALLTESDSKYHQIGPIVSV